MGLHDGIEVIHFYPYYNSYGFETTAATSWFFFMLLRDPVVKSPLTIFFSPQVGWAKFVA